ncbi:MAG TPA: FIST N-terminal domain-containing protein [Gammaproteobacteria bacterium]|nr:FIST N-terminal domain-containing protein [Gammaproteobacteria bacterium]
MRIRFAHASGASWRDAVDHALNALGPAGREATLGFCYLTEAIGGEAAAALERLREHSDVAHWTGTVGLGICCDGLEYFDTPAAVLLTLALPEADFRVFSTSKADLSDLETGIARWIDTTSPRFGIVHGDPRSPDLEAIIAALSSRLGGGFLVGGLSSTRLSHFQLADGIVEGGVSGVLFSGEVAVSTRLSQGCAPIGPRHAVGRADGNLVLTLDGRPAVEVFAADIAALGNVDPATLAGTIHVAIPVTGSDTGDYMVRNLLGIDPERGAIAVGELLDDVEQIMFCRRDASSAESDLLRMLGELKKGIDGEPKGGVYFSCVARGPNLFGPDSRELKIIQNAIGSLPLAGFFGNGEISNDRLYGYTGVLTLFV